jgi:site-specific recombinase XerD
MTQQIAKDESLHQFSKRYAQILHRLFPTEFSTSNVRKTTKPYSISEGNRVLLKKFYYYIEADATRSIAHRAKLFELLGVLGEMINKPFNTLTREDVEMLIAQIRNKPSWNLTTQNYHLNALKVLLKYLNGGRDYPACIAWLELKNNKGSPIKKEDLVTEEEMGKIIQSADHPMHRCILSLLWEGLRASELGCLKIRNLTQEGKEIFISVHGKTGDRTVLSLSGAPSIRTWLDQHPTKKPDDWLFVITSNVNKGKRLNYSSIAKIVRTACQKAGIQNRRTNLHAFRHSSITDRRKKGMRQREASVFYGVSGKIMTQVYDHLADADVYNEIRRVLGVEKEIEKPTNSLEPKHCIICQKMNPHYSMVCLNCGNALSTEDAIRGHDIYTIQ